MPGRTKPDLLDPPAFCNVRVPVPGRALVTADCGQPAVLDVKLKNSANIRQYRCAEHAADQIPTRDVVRRRSRA